MRFLSVCSGIEAASVAWHPLGWTPVAFSEIEPFPSAVLAHRFPDVPNFGDMTKHKEWSIEDGSVDLVCGGTPCQSFSVAGLRKGMDDPRGNLALVYLAMVDRLRPRWVVWENVPGVLSSSGGRDFGAFLGGLGQLGYGFAYRVLDAQYFGVPQRRRRVFVVGHLGDWRPAAAVLFERHSLQGHNPPSREKRQGIAPTISARTNGGGGLGTDFDCDGGLICAAHGQGNAETLENLFPTLNCNYEQPIVAGMTGNGFWREGSCTLRGRPQDSHENLCVQLVGGSSVRRLTPVEYERLQGFPDNWTRIPWRGKAAEDCPDGLRYKAIGNSMAVPVMGWIGERIQSVETMKGGA